MKSKQTIFILVALVAILAVVLLTIFVLNSKKDSTPFINNPISYPTSLPLSFIQTSLKPASYTISNDGKIKFSLQTPTLGRPTSPFLNFTSILPLDTKVKSEDSSQIQFENENYVLSIFTSMGESGGVFPKILSNEVLTTGFIYKINRIGIDSSEVNGGVTNDKFKRFFFYANLFKPQGGCTADNLPCGENEIQISVGRIPGKQYITIFCSAKQGFENTCDQIVNSTMFQ